MNLDSSLQCQDLVGHTCVSKMVGVKNKSADKEAAAKATIEEAAGKTLVSLFPKLFVGIVRDGLKLCLLINVIQQNQDKGWRENLQITHNEMRNVGKISGSEEAMWRGLLQVQQLPDIIVDDIKYIADKKTEAVAEKITVEKCDGDDEDLERFRCVLEL